MVDPPGICAAKAPRRKLRRISEAAVSYSGACWKTLSGRQIRVQVWMRNDVLAEHPATCKPAIAAARIPWTSTSPVRLVGVIKELEHLRQLPEQLLLGLEANDSRHDLTCGCKAGGL